MRVLKIILLVLVVLAGAFAIWMSTLDSTFKVERSIVIDAEAEQVYAATSDFTTWPTWSPWLEMDPEAKVAYGEVSSGEGATYSWESEKIGAGTMNFVEADPGKFMKTHLVIDGMGESDCIFSFEPSEDGLTTINWTITGELPFYSRFLGMALEENLGKDFERGLEKLKIYVESNKPAKPEYQFSRISVTPVPFYGIKDEVSFQDINKEFYDSRFGEILAYLGEGAQDSVNGNPLAIYEKYDEENMMATLIIALPANSKMKGNDRVFKGETHAGEAIKTVHVGPYESSSEAYSAMDDYFEKNQLEIGGAPWEVYVKNPGNEPDSSKWITEIYYPILSAEANLETKE